MNDTNVFDDIRRVPRIKERIITVAKGSALTCVICGELEEGDKLIYTSSYGGVYGSNICMKCTVIACKLMIGDKN